MSERFVSPRNEPRFAWPPFMVAQFDVLGKDCSLLRTSLEDPSIDESKAFEALTQLAVLVRLLSGEHHELVPHSDNIPEMNFFKATEIFHVHKTVETIDRVIEVVMIEFRQRRHVLQLVAVPNFAQTRRQLEDCSWLPVPARDRTTFRRRCTGSSIVCVDRRKLPKVQGPRKWFALAEK
jgi:hypothetical protein